MNLKQHFAALTDGKPRTMKEALRVMGLPLQGRHHRGIDDALNIAKLAAWILPRVPRDSWHDVRQEVAPTTQHARGFPD